MSQELCIFVYFSKSNVSASPSTLLILFVRNFSLYQFSSFVFTLTSYNHNSYYITQQHEFGSECFLTHSTLTIISVKKCTIESTTL